MVQYSSALLDSSFGALSDATRRGVLERLARGDATISDLAAKFHMTLTGMKKHVGILEMAGLVTTEKVGRSRTCRLGVGGMDHGAAWIEAQRQLWQSRFDALDDIIETLNTQENPDDKT
jgi:DNA-binding transcriptional ArsR family regulator